MYALCIIALLLSLVQQNRHNPITKPDNTQKPNTESHNKQSSSSENGIRTHYEIHQHDEKTQQQKQYDEFDRKFQHWYWGVTIVGVVISLGLFGALIYQNKLTRKTAQAARDSANALMRIERAWLFFWYEKFAHVNYQDRTIGERELAHHFNWHCENAGKTPAFVITIWCRLIEIKSLDHLPTKPDYSMSKEVVYEGDPLRPGDKTEWFTASLESTETNCAFDAVEKRHRSRQSFLYAYGFVRYRDVFGRLQIARFGVVYESEPELNFEMDHWRVAGPAAYNEYQEDTTAQ